MQPMEAESGARGYTTSSHNRMDSKSSLLSPSAQTQTLLTATSEFVSFNFLPGMFNADSNDHYAAV